jgi:hypothetical protein
LGTTGTGQRDLRGEADLHHGLPLLRLGWSLMSLMPLGERQKKTSFRKILGVGLDIFVIYFLGWLVDSYCCNWSWLLLWCSCFEIWDCSGSNSFGSIPLSKLPLSGSSERPQHTKLISKWMVEIVGAGPIWSGSPVHAQRNGER